MYGYDSVLQVTAAIKKYNTNFIVVLAYGHRFPEEYPQIHNYSDQCKKDQMHNHINLDDVNIHVIYSNQPEEITCIFMRHSFWWKFKECSSRVWEDGDSLSWKSLRVFYLSSGEV